LKSSIEPYKIRFQAEDGPLPSILAEKLNGSTFRGYRLLSAVAKLGSELCEVFTFDAAHHHSGKGVIHTMDTQLLGRIWPLVLTWEFGESKKTWQGVFTLLEEGTPFFEGHKVCLCLSVSACVCLCTICRSLCLYFFLSVCLSVCLSVYVYIYIYIYISFSLYPCECVCLTSSSGVGGGQRQGV
jgi:hypothetical protein